MLREHNIISENITFPSPLRQGEIIAAAALSTSERRRSRQFIQNGVFGNYSSNSELPAGCKWNAATGGIPDALLSCRPGGVRCGLTVIRPEPRNLESLVSALFGE
jgi:hypothetical protein